MPTTTHYCRTVLIASLSACLWSLAGMQAASASDTVSPRVHDPLTRIDRVLDNAVLAERIEAWGISVAELRADVQSLSDRERLTLAVLLEKSWTGIDDDRQPDVTAQFLATIAMMRESSLFVGVISNWLGSPP